MDLGVRHDETVRVEMAARILAMGGLLVVLVYGLVSSFFAGFLIYSLVHMLTPPLARLIRNDRARLVAVAALSLVVIGILAAAVWAGVAFFRSDTETFQTLLQKLADILESSRGQVPDWMKDMLPVDADALNVMITEWLRAHAAEAKAIGEEAGRSIVHIIIGLVIGVMAALRSSAAAVNTAPLASALRRRLVLLNTAFQNVVFAQVRISAINTLIVAVFIFLLLPLSGVHLPLAKSLTAVTFFSGLLPVVGNLISNTMLVIVGLSQSVHTAFLALLFMVVIHKLEYFLNAKIIGGQINSRVWELLTAMLVMESVFGLRGVVAAPVFYAYLKAELAESRLI